MTSEARDGMAFGTLLHELLGEAGLTWAELGRRTGVERAAASKWRTGAHPPASKVPAIIAALSPSWADLRRLVTAYARETGTIPVGIEPAATWCVAVELFINDETPGGLPPCPTRPT